MLEETPFWERYNILMSITKEVLSRLVGLSACDAYANIIKNLPEIKFVSIFKYLPPKTVQLRSDLSDSDRQVISRGLKIRAQLGLPFWDSIMLVIMKDHIGSSSLLNACRYHQSSKKQDMLLSRQVVLRGFLQRTVDLCQPNESVSLISEIRLRNGRIGHIPFLDFHCPVSKRAEPLVLAVAKKIFCGSVLVLNSGHSYHAVGTTILKSTALTEFLARALLFGPIVDRAYIAHQLIEQRCALRISRGGHNNAIPKVIAIIEGEDQSVS